MEDSKVKFAERKHFSAGNSATYQVGDFRTSCVIGDKGRYHYTDNSKSNVFNMNTPIKTERYSIRIVKDTNKHQEFVPRGRKYIKPPSRVEKEYSKISMIAPNVGSKLNDIAPNWKSKGRVSYLRTQRDYGIESIMTRKKRIPNDCTTLINGNKPYASPECDSNFYVSGGLIVGSTIDNKRCLNELRKSKVVMVGTSALAKPDLIRTEIQRKQEIEEVYALSKQIVSTEDGKIVPGWEERSGCRLLLPSNEPANDDF